MTAGGPAEARAPLRVCIDARLGQGKSGGVEQVVIGIASGLSKLGEGEEEYLFLAYPEHEDWIRDRKVNLLFYNTLDKFGLT